MVELTESDIDAASVLAKVHNRDAGSRVIAYRKRPPSRHRNAHLAEIIRGDARRVHCDGGTLASDVLNLGGNKNENTITGALGAEVRPCRNFALRGAYERALNDDADLFGHRWTVSAVIKF